MKSTSENLDSPEFRAFVAKYEALGWKWIDQRSGSAYEWINPDGIYCIFGPEHPSHNNFRLPKSPKDSSPSLSTD